MKFEDVGQKRQGGEGSAGSLFLKLKDGDRVKGVFRGNPKIYKQHWINKRSAVCPGKDTCEHCKAGDKPKFRFRLNFLTLENGVWLAKIFEQGYGTYLDLKEMHESDSGYDLPTTCVILARSGEGTDTRYRITPAKDNGGMKAEHFKKLDKIPLNDLSLGAREPEAPEPVSVGADPDEDTDSDDMPF